MSPSQTTEHARNDAHVELDVEGMTCAGCQAHVQRALEKTPGVRAATVDLLLGNARVDFDATAATPESLVAAVNATGYHASVREAGASPADEAQERELAAEAEFRQLRTKAVVSGAIGVLAMVASMPLMASGHGHTSDPLMAWISRAIDPRLREMAPWLYELDARQLSLALWLATTFVLAWAGRQFFVRAWTALLHRSANMSTLIAVGTGAAYAYSTVATFAPQVFTNRGASADVYFEVVVMIVALVLTGSAIEARARRKASAALRGLIALQPATARVVRDFEELDVPLRSVRKGDVVVVRPGERVAVDGEVVDGASAVDESLVTGESTPVDKHVGARVIGGSLNTTGVLRVRATSLGSESTLARIVELMRAAQGSRAPIQKLADRISAVFVPTVVALSIVTLIAWLAFAKTAPLAHGLSAAVAVLIIACPCAMGLAVPTAVMVASGRGAKEGLLIKGGEALERAARVTTVALDKTGTVTEGRPSVTSVVLAPDSSIDERELMRLAASVESSSEHPLASAIVRRARELSLAIAPVQRFESRPGFGALGFVGERRVVVGNPGLLAQLAIDASSLDAAVERLASEGNTAMLVAVDDRIAGVIAAADQIAESSRAAIERLERMGLDVVMLTGDDARTARSIARRAGIARALANLTPEGKVFEIQALQSEGRVVAMVGDGVNDAPALARADVGIAIGTGADVATHASDVTLMRADLRGVATSIALSRATLRTMRRNLFWAFLYNSIGIPVAAGALYPAFGLTLSPILASAAMALSSISVITSSLWLARAKLA